MPSHSGAELVSHLLEALIVGIRETLNEQKQLGIIVGIVILVLGVALIIWQAVGPNHPSGAAAKQLYFSIDNGQTWYADGADKVPPYLYKGKEALLAHVYQWSGGTFVEYLEKYAPRTQSKLSAIPAGPKRDAAVIDSPPGDDLVKTPVGQFWVKKNSAAGQRIIENHRPPNNNPESGFEIFP